MFTKDIARQVLSEETELLKRTAADAKTVAEKKSKLAEKAESDLRELKDAIRAARAAGEKVAKLVDGEAQSKKTPQGDFTNQINDIFKNGIPYRPGGFNW